MAHQSPWDSLSFVDAFREQEGDELEYLLHQLRVPEGFRACRRSDVMVKRVPPEDVCFGKWLQSTKTPENGGRTVLNFRDGSTAEADVGE